MKCTVYCVELAHSTVYFGECCTCCSTYSAPNGTNMASDLYLLTSSFMVAICLINLIIILCIPDEESDDKRLMARCQRANIVRFPGKLKPVVVLPLT